MDFSYDLAPSQDNVTYRGKKYILHEATEGVVMEWKKAVLATTKVSIVDGKPSVDASGVASADAVLVALCLRDHENKTVPLTEVLGWNPKFVRSLAARVKEVSSINESSKEELSAQIKRLQAQLDADKQSKNSQDATTPTSV
jgi:serine/threonine protein phosphatase PrpC